MNLRQSKLIVAFAALALFQTACADDKSPTNAAEAPPAAAPPPRTLQQPPHLLRQPRLNRRRHLPAVFAPLHAGEYLRRLPRHGRA